MMMRYGLVLCVVMVTMACAPAGEPPVEIEEAPVEGLANGSFTAELNGFEIHYEVHGSGPVMMVVTNSWGFDIVGLRRVLGGLEERLTMVYFDPRGRGGSAPIREDSDMGLAAVRADFDALRQHLGLETVNAIGWSNGATNLITLAAEYPQTIDAAVFLHGAASFTEEDMKDFGQRFPEILNKYMQYQQMVADPEISDADKTAAMRVLWLEQWFPLATADPEGAPAVFVELFDGVSFDWRYADYSNREAPALDVRDQLPLITARSLVIAGSHDTMPVAKAEEMHTGLADSELLVLEGSGHFAPVEEPEAFEQAVYGFLGVD